MTVVLTRTFFTLFTSVLAAALCLALFSQNVLAQETPDEEDTSGEVEAKAELKIEPDPQQTARENTQADRAALSDELTASTAQQRAAVQERVAQRKDALEVRVQERVTNLAANMSNRMEAVIERLQNIANRLESRMTKMADSGINTEASVAALASAQISLDAARAEIEDIDVAVYAAVSSANARTGWTTLKTKFVTIKSFIKTAHRELGSSITLLKAETLKTRAEQSAEVGVE